MRTRPFLERGDIENKTAPVGTNTTLPCYELISGTIPDFRWLKWKHYVNYSILNDLPKESKDMGEYLQVLKAENYKQVSKPAGNNDRVLYGVELVLNNVTVNDSGWYTCLVSNHIGSDYASMYLSVGESTSKLLFPLEPGCKLNVPKTFSLHSVFRGFLFGQNVTGYSPNFVSNRTNVSEVTSLKFAKY